MFDECIHHSTLKCNNTIEADGYATHCSFWNLQLHLILSDMVLELSANTFVSL